MQSHKPERQWILLGALKSCWFLEFEDNNWYLASICLEITSTWHFWADAFHHRHLLRCFRPLMRVINSTLCCGVVVMSGPKMSNRFTYLLLLKLPRNTTNNAVWLSSLHRVDLSEIESRKRTFSEGNSLIRVCVCVSKNDEDSLIWSGWIRGGGRQRSPKAVSTPTVENDQFAMKIDWKLALLRLFLHAPAVAGKFRSRFRSFP